MGMGTAGGMVVKHYSMGWEGGCDTRLTPPVTHSILKKRGEMTNGKQMGIQPQHRQVLHDAARVTVPEWVDRYQQDPYDRRPSYYSLGSSTS